jgi:hypothetical protein
MHTSSAFSRTGESEWRDTMGWTRSLEEVMDSLKDWIALIISPVFGDELFLMTAPA